MSTGDIPVTAVILLNWNNAGETMSCLAELNSLGYPADRLPIYVVDNGSTDGSAALLAAEKGIHFIPLKQNRGFAGGNNAGIQQALADGSQFILLLNSDTELSDSFIETLHARLEHEPQAGMVSPKIHYPGTPPTLWYAGGRFHQPRILGELTGMDQPDRGQYDRATRVDFTVGCCMLVRRQVFEDIGLLDDDLFFYHEDVDFSYRAAQAGWQSWYEPAAVIIHKVSHSTRDNLPHRTYLYAQARTVFLRKHIRGWKSILVVPMEIARLLRQVIHFTALGKTENSKNYIKGILSGLRQEITSGPDRKTPKIWIRLVSLLVALSIFSFLGIRAARGVQDILTAGLTVTPIFLLASFLCQLTGVLLAAAVWSNILKRLNIRTGYLYDLKSFTASALARKIPGPLWYAVGRLALYELRHQSRSKTIIALAVEAIMISIGGTVALTIGIGQGIIIPWVDRRLLTYLITPSIIGVTLYFAPQAIRFFIRLTNKDKNNLEDGLTPISHWDTLRWIIGETGVVILASGVVYFLLKAFLSATGVPYLAILGAYGMAVAIGPLAIWLPADIGLKDGFMYLALSPFIDSHMAALLTLAWRLWVSLLEISFGGVSLIFLANQLKLTKSRLNQFRTDKRHD